MKEISDKKILESVQISFKSTLHDSIQRMNDSAQKILVVVDNQKKVIGTITDGDIRRGIISGLSMSSLIDCFFNSKPKLLVEDSYKAASEIMIQYEIDRVPLLDENGFLKKIYILDTVNYVNGVKYVNKVVVMAGGKGVRLKPITDIIPKPLLPISGKPIIHRIMEVFNKSGFSKFLFTLNYKKDMIKLYLDSIKDDSLNISVIEEEDFLGTAGSLSLIKNIEKQPVFLTNCDILLDIDYGKALKFHEKNNNEITIIGNLQEISVPYGILNQLNGAFIDIEEKPTLHYTVNTGIYILNNSVIERIPYNKRIDMPDVVNNEKTLGSKIGVYPTHEKWFDIGNWADLQKNC